jgi:(1->4)-alpha-D-glucan 1-alpha-D-glucosylmutase
MLTTATHDHKRGEDVRARLAVLSELPELWAEAVGSWTRLTAAVRPACIAADDAYALYQTLVGVWPFDLAPDDGAGLSAFGERVAGWRLKSLREAKKRSSWAVPDEAYEAANLDWLKALLDPVRSAPFLRSLHDFVMRVAPAGAVNGVVQAALRCAWPGVPDLYQGAELWDLSLVDPDNRRPVDYALRGDLLGHGARAWISGGVKQAVIARLLGWRRADPELFTHAALERLEVRGPRAGHILAFRRCIEGRVASVAVMLRVADAVRTLGELPGARWWDGTEVATDAGWHRAEDMFSQSPVFASLRSYETSKIPLTARHP